jgi:two-component system, chemotaxis family, protein-glutamate methylesterase/glutaminase
VPQSADLAPYDVVAIGSSAGGVEALHTLVTALPADLPVAVLIVQHLDPRHKSVLAALLSRHSRLPVKQAVHDEPIRPAAIYIAPPDRHLLVANGRIELSQSQLVHFTRPSIDLLFESVAGAYGERVIGIILTGTGFDGATGIRAVKRMGGTTIVQDPAQAAHSGMPHAAHATGCVDYVLALDEIGPTIVQMVASRTTERARLTDGQ